MSICVMPFCANKRCPNNKIIVRRNQYSMNARVAGKEVVLERHMYANESGVKFELCSICHAACEMVKK